MECNSDFGYNFASNQKKIKTMKKLHYSIICLSIVAAFTACTKEDNGDKYAPYTVEQNKANIQLQGIEMINEARDMRDLQSWKAAESMTHFMNMADPFGGMDGKNINRSTIVRLMKPITIAASASENNPDFVGKQLKGMTDDSTFMDGWDMLTGIYTWNSTLEQWDYEDTGNEILFRFPSTPEGTQNNAEFRIYGFEVYNGIYAYTGETVEIPVALHATLKVNNAEVLGFNYQTNINNQGYVTSVTIELTAMQYSWGITVTYTPHNKASFKEWLKKNNDVLIETYFGMEGNFEENNVELSIDQEIPENILHNANAYIQVMNIKLEGLVNFNELMPAMRQLENDSLQYNTDSAFMAANARILNDNTDMYLRYAAENTIIALIDFIPYKQVESYSYWYWDYQLEQYVEETYTYTYWDIKPRFTFGDGSTMDADTFFETGFDSFIDELDSFMGEME